AEPDQDGGDGRHAGEPDDDHQRLEASPTANRLLAMLAQLANARVPHFLAAPAFVSASGHLLSSVSRYCCRMMVAAAESSSPDPRLGRLPAAASRSPASNELNRSST